MPEDRLNPQPGDAENLEGAETGENLNDERFVSDTQKLVRKHMEDKDHVISEEDIANIRVGMVPPEFDAATEVRFEDEEVLEETEDKLLEGKKTDPDENLDDKRITPWDAVDPT